MYADDGFAQRASYPHGTYNDNTGIDEMVRGRQTTVTDNTGKLLYNVKEMRQALGIGKNSAYDLLKRNDFPKIIINGRYYIPVDKLKKWIDKETNRSLRRSA